MSQRVRTAKSRLAAARRWHPNADTTDLDRDLKFANAEDYIRRLVDTAPPLTADQRDRLAVLLRPARKRRDDGPEAA
ncbi:hypothetical protein ABN034_09355 [Actinopolymorpha sp. B11F2]|uniref:hypothetical protein n=1 Tax=Actinopolymorpha sp. B11F2 TaxID=3160862 RepID=UPI0032E41B87